MKLLLVTPLYPQYPGQSRREITYALHDFACYWNRVPGISIIVVNPLKRILIAKRKLRFSGTQQTYIDGVKVINAPLWNIPGYRFTSTKPIELCLRETNFIPDVIAAHTCVGAEVAASINETLVKPCLFALHQSDFVRPERIRKLSRSFSAIAFRSVHLEALFRNLFFPPLRSFVATSGVEKNEILNKPKFIAKTFHHPIRILSVNSLRAYKNVDMVLQALSRLHQSLHWSYTIIGDGEERQNLESLTAGLNLRSRVSFLGERPRSECLRMMEHSDVFVLVSAPETFGLVYLEAMAKGMIVIGTKGTGIDGIVKHGQNGFLCSARSDLELSEVLFDLLDRRDLQHMREAAYETIVKNTIEETAEAYLNFIRTTANCNV